MTARSKGKTWANDDSAPQLDQAAVEAAAVATAAGSDDELYEDLPPKKDAKQSGKGDEDEDEDEVEGKEQQDDMDEDEADTTQGTEQKPAEGIISERGAKKEAQQGKAPEEMIEDTGRLFVRNLPYTCTEKDLKERFDAFGPVSEVNSTFDKANRHVGSYFYVHRSTCRSPKIPNVPRALHT